MTVIEWLFKYPLLPMLYYKAPQNALDSNTADAPLHYKDFYNNMMVANFSRHYHPLVLQYSFQQFFRALVGRIICPKFAAKGAGEDGLLHGVDLGDDLLGNFLYLYLCF